MWALIGAGHSLLGCGPSMMLAMPAKLSAASTQSVVDGRILSASISQTITTST